MGCIALDARGVILARESAGLLLLGVLAILLLVTGLATGRPPGLPAGFVLLACGYLAALYVANVTFDWSAAAFGSGLLLVAEIAYWSLELRTPTRDVAGMRARRVVRTSILVRAALTLNLLTASIIQLPVSGSLMLTVVGAISAIVAFGLLAVLAWRTR